MLARRHAGTSVRKPCCHVNTLARELANSTKSIKRTEFDLPMFFKKKSIIGRKGLQYHNIMKMHQFSR